MKHDEKEIAELAAKLADGYTTKILQLSLSRIEKAAVRLDDQWKNGQGRERYTICEGFTSPTAEGLRAASAIIEDELGLLTALEPAPSPVAWTGEGLALAKFGQVTL